MKIKKDVSMKKITFLMLAIFSANLSYATDTATQNNINKITKHYYATPNLYDFENMPKEALSDKIDRQYVMGSKTMLVKWTFKKGAVVPLHFHPNEQISWITKGSVSVASQGKKYIVKAGEVIIIPPNVPHKFVALEDTIDIDIFSPVREDWLNNTANYIHAIEKK